jgi:hypothetical protein
LLIIAVCATAGAPEIGQTINAALLLTAGRRNHNAVVECTKCFKWRRVINGINPDQFGDDWSCFQNTWDKYKRCDVPAEFIEYDIEVI